MASKLDKILSGFTKLTNKLQSFVDNSEESMQDCRAQMTRVETELSNHTDDRDKAKRVLANVQKLIEE